MRWTAVGGTGVGCGALLAWLLHALTGSWALALVGGTAIAMILVVLAVGGARQNATFRHTREQEADAHAKRERVREAMRRTREDTGN